MRLLDILIATLVIFPWLTEGVTLSLGSVYLADVSDLNVPLLVAALAAGAVLSRREVQVAVGRGMALAAGPYPARKLWTGMAALAALTAVVATWGHWAASYPGLDPSLALRNLTRGTGAVCLVALAGMGLQRVLGEPWEKSLFLRQAMRLGAAWQGAVAGAPARTLWSAAAVVGAAFLWVALVRHRAFESHGWDLGIFTNTMWNLTHGNGYVSSFKGGINLFADHQSPLFWALAPFFWLAPRPETLLAAQAFGLAAGGPAVYYLGRAHFGRAHWASSALPWLYWSYLPFRNANAFDFHPEVFMLPLFLWAFVGFQSQRRFARGLGVLALVAALGAKESAAVVAFGIGVAWALSSGGNGRRGRWPGIAVAAAGVAVFLFDIKMVPRLLGGEYAYLGMYERFGGGVSGLLLAPFTRPAYFFSELFDAERLRFLFWTLAPIGFLPLFHWRSALAAAPAYLMLFLSEGNQRVQLFFHYGIEPGTALFWALPFGLGAFAAQFGWRRAGIWLLVWGVAFHGATEIARARSYFQYLHADWLGSQVVPCLDPDASMAASDSLSPHLATRAWISYPDQLHDQPAGNPVRCVVTDLSVGNWPLGARGTREMRARLAASGYRQAWRCHDLTIHEREGAQCLRCQPKCY